jgi:hypothetical protein
MKRLATFGHVRQRETALPSSATRTLALLPIRRTPGASGRMRGSGSRLLQLAAGLDRASGQAAMRHAACADPASQHQLLHPLAGFELTSVGRFSTDSRGCESRTGGHASTLSIAIADRN